MTSSYSKKNADISLFVMTNEKLFKELFLRILFYDYTWTCMGSISTQNHNQCVMAFRWKDASGSVINTPEFMKNLQHEPFSAELNVDRARENVMFKVINNHDFSAWKLKAKFSTTSKFCMIHVWTRFIFELSFKMCVKCTWRQHVIFV